MTAHRHRRRPDRRLILVVGAVVLTPFGCFVDFDDFSFDVGAGPTSTSSATSASGPGGSGGASAAGGAAAGGAGPTSASGAAGPGGSTSSAGGQGGTGVAAGVPGEVACGSASCNLMNGQICCVPKNLMGSAFCHNGATCPGNEGEMSCDGPEDCMGSDDCCGDFSLQNGGYELVNCRASCTGAATFLLCASTADCSGSDVCQTTIYLPPNVQACF